MPDNIGNGTVGSATSTSNSTNSNANVNGTVRGIGDVLVDGYIKLGFGYLTDVTNHYYTALTQSIRIQEAALTKQNQAYMAAIQKASAIMQNNLDITLSGFSKTANEIATQSLKLRVSEFKESVKAAKTKYIAEKDYLVKRMTVQGEMVKSFSTMASNYASNVYGLYKGLVSIGDNNSGLSDITRQLVQEEGSLLKEGISGILHVAQGIGEIGIDFADQSVKIANDAIAKQVSYNIDVLQYEKLKADLISQHIESVIDSASNVLDKYITLYETIQDTAAKADTAGHIQAEQTGWGGKGDTFTQHILNVTRDIAETFGKTTEELISMQESYINESTRNTILSQSDYERMLGIGRGFGLGDDETARLFGSMAVFNTSMSDGDRMLTKMYKSITKMGLSSTKFGKELVSNMEKAQKYNFKGGLENMMKITQWAQQTRFNLSSATGFSDKLMDGTISEALEASAKLQVLGGAAAMYSDPMAMIYEAGADVGSLAKRQAAFFEGLGTFNEKTGETEFNWFDERQIRNIAKAAGMTTEDAKNVVRQRHTQIEVGDKLKDSGLDDETKTAIANVAKFNREIGNWEVTDIYRQKHTLSELMNANDTERKKILDNLMPQNNEDSMVQIAQKSLGFAREQTNVQHKILAMVAAHDYGNIITKSRENTKKEKDFYEKNKNDIYTMTEFMRNESANALAEQYLSDETNMPYIKDLLVQLITTSNKIARGASNESDIKDMRKSLEILGKAYDEHARDARIDPYEYFVNKMYGTENDPGMYYNQVKENSYTVKQLMDLRSNEGQQEFYWFNDDLSLMSKDFTDFVVPWYKKNLENVTSAGLDETVSVSEKAAEIVSDPIKREIKEREFGSLILGILDAIGVAEYDDYRNFVGDRYEDIRNRVLNIINGNNGNNGANGNDNTGTNDGPVSYNEPQPHQTTQEGIITHQSTDYSTQATATPTPHPVQESDEHQNPEPASSAIQYPTMGNDMSQLMTVPISDAMDRMNESLDRLNGLIDNMSMRQVQLVIDNNVGVSATNLTTENVQRAIMDSFNDPGWTSRLSEALSVVSSGTYQYNGMSPAT